MTGGLALGANALTITTARGEPLKVVGNVEVHATGWFLLGVVFLGLFGASMAPIIDRWLFEPRRQRTLRFGELKPEVDRILKNLYRGIRDRPNRAQPEHSSPAENLEMLELTNGLNVRLRAIGVGQITGLDVTEYLTLVDMMERGALREARKRFPLKGSV